MAGASDNGGRPPGGGSPDDLPDLPEEWGVIVIPDDLSELAEEVAAVRAELHTGPPLTRWQLFARRPAMRRLRRFGTLLVRTPALIVSVAFLVTIASLFASAWPGPPRQPATQRTSGTTDSQVDTLPALDLVGPGRTVALRSFRPAVVMLTDGCDCATLLADTLTAVRADVAVLAITRAQFSTAPSAGVTVPTSHTPNSTVGSVPGITPSAATRNAVLLSDPTDTLRDHYGFHQPDGTAAVILVDRTGNVLRTHQSVASLQTILDDLARL